jgi:hypothetical protein
VTSEKIISKVVSILSPAESLAASGLSGMVSKVTTTDAKGIENDDNVMSCMFVTGTKSKQVRRRSAFLESECSLTNCLETSRGFLPGISVEVVDAKAESKDNHRTVFKAGSDAVVRKVSFLPPFSPAPSSKLQKFQTHLLSHDGLPRSLPLMVRFLYTELESLRLFSEFLPPDMDRLIESEIGRFVFLMSSLFASLSDSSDTTICSSPDGIWRGMVYLIYHQYIDSFSSREKGMYQVFYPEMLCCGFETNSAYLWRQYAWKTSQLTGAVHNYLRFSCSRCQQSKLSYSSCITAGCVKIRDEEATLHVFLDGKGKPLSDPVKA